MDCGAFVRVRCLAVLGLVACLPPFFLFFLFFAFLFVSLPAFCPSPCLFCSGCLLLVLLSCLSFPALFCSFFFPFGLYAKRKGRNSLRPLLSCCGLVMQNRVLRSRKTRNYWPQCLLLCIRRSWSIHNRSATAQKNLREYSQQNPAR